MISPDAANLGVKAIYMWAALLVPTIAVLYFYYPEVSHWSIDGGYCAKCQTYGRTYLELDELYERRIPAWKFKSTSTAADLSGGKNQTLIHHRAKDVGAV